MIDLTSRQVQILKLIIEEYLSSAEPVGSDTLDKKFNLGVSPATIRNEMAYLSEQGYLKQPHTSAGRIPTPMALRIYVKELMNKKDLSVADEVQVKERMYETRDNLEELLHEATRVLADRSKAIGIALTDDHHVYHAGYAHLLNMPEFLNIDVTRTVLTLLEEINQLESIFGRNRGEEPVQMVFGDDLGNQYLEPVSIVYTNFISKDRNCALGVIGSSRLDFSYVVPMLEHMQRVIQGLAK